MYPASQLNSLINSNRVPVDSFGLSTYTIMSANYNHFIYFSYPTSLAKTISRTFNRSGDSRYICFIPALKGNTFSISSLSQILAIGFNRCSLLY